MKHYILLYQYLREKTKKLRKELFFLSKMKFHKNAENT